jgi:hypothetical protein
VHLSPFLSFGVGGPWRRVLKIRSCHEAAP